MKYRAQGAVEYLLMVGLVLIVIVWSLYYIKVIRGGQEHLASSLSSDEQTLNRKILSEVSSNLNSG
ncbi:class III signal peptide-containing protein [Thermococcus sp.]|uniref:class III signal peptide-containing protein n=1 Tax=Thermococcus sp. TaxID=35749 RepID=UPI00262FEEAC|nr:class III signal peptide-containing protein [Thermococcus sp.]